LTYTVDLVSGRPFIFNNVPLMHSIQAKGAVGFGNGAVSVQVEEAAPFFRAQRVEWQQVGMRSPGLYR
jgi:hypothetical protein